jgi:hypothetical protein
VASRNRAFYVVVSFPANLPMYTTNRPSHGVAFEFLTAHLYSGVSFTLLKLVPMNLFVLLNQYLVGNFTFNLFSLVPMRLFVLSIQYCSLGNHTFISFSCFVLCVSER